MNEKTILSEEKQDTFLLLGAVGIGIGIITTGTLVMLARTQTRKKVFTIMNKGKKLLKNSVKDIVESIDETTEDVSLQNYISHMEHATVD